MEELDWEYGAFDDVGIDESVKGVYCICQESKKCPGKFGTIRVGSGIIANRLSDHRNNDEITQYTNLMLAWANVSEESAREGIERYLGDTLKPIVPEEDARFPTADPIPVNLPYPYVIFNTSET